MWWCWHANRKMSLRELLESSCGVNMASWENEVVYTVQTANQCWWWKQILYEWIALCRIKQLCSLFTFIQQCTRSVDQTRNKEQSLLNSLLTDILTKDRIYSSLYYYWASSPLNCEFEMKASLWGWRVKSFVCIARQMFRIEVDQPQKWANNFK